MRYILLVYLYIIIPGFAAAQDNKEWKSLFLEGEYFFLRGEYEEALYIYTTLLETDPSNANIEFLIGACYLSMDAGKSKAIPYLEKAVENISPSYREGNYKEKKAPREALFALARAYHIRNELQKARIFYAKYRDIMNLRDGEEIDFVYKQIESCNNAEIMLKNPLPYTRTDFSPGMETDSSGFNGIMASRAPVMLYLSQKPFYTAIMMTRLENGTWTTPSGINQQLEIEGHYKICSLSADGTELYLSIEEDSKYDIYTSKYQDGSWSAAEKLNDNINTIYSETHACVSGDGKKLFFTSDRPGGVGAMDIYVSKLDAGGEWGPATNMGKTVNTVYSEETPFISEDGFTLYFSSMGHKTMGGFDIFSSSPLSSGEWSDPVNIGYPVSTCEDDLFYYPLGNGRQAIFSGFMDQADNGLKVYMLNLDAAVKPEYLALEESFAPKKESAEPVKETLAEYEFEDEVITESPGSPVENESVETTRIRNIFFGFDDYSLNAESQAELEKLSWAMELYPELRVGITGHTDSRGNETYNMELSLKRAKSVADYLVAKGIPRGRLEYDGMGEKEIIALNRNPDGSDSPEGRQMNRCADLNILSEQLSRVFIEPVKVPARLQPAKAEGPVAAVAGADEDTVINPVYYNFNKSDLKDEGKRELAKLYRIMLQYPRIILSVTGHSDEIGSEEYNLELSVKRAKSVADYLVSLGIAPGRIEYAGKGENENIALNRFPDGRDCPQGRQLNRRSVFVLLNNYSEQVRIAPIEIPRDLRHPPAKEYTDLGGD